MNCRTILKTLLKVDNNQYHSSWEKNLERKLFADFT